MNIYLSESQFKYEIEKLCRIFLPFERFDFTEDEKSAQILCILKRTDQKVTLSAELSLFSEHAALEESTEETNLKELERRTAALLYRCFEKITGYRSPWGILTGVRPAKLFASQSKILGDDGARRYFRERLLVSQNKIDLLNTTANSEKAIIDLSKKRSASVYIGIPFCPSRCSYCSFVSHSVEHAKKLIPQYVALLCREIEKTAEIAKKLDLRIETVYIGGGTPTTLSGAQLSAVMGAVNTHFKLQNLREFTVEAGRPDTVTEERLLSILQGGATRISINPQTMNDRVLRAVGRRHTAEDTVKAMDLARRLGFSNINMDLIAGLPEDTPESFQQSLAEVLKLSPESVTVHTLCLKRSAKLTVDGCREVLKQGEEAEKMVDYAKNTLIEAGIFPYYMYRQSKMVGNLENVGYAKPGFEGLYNVYIMDETHTILACGASAVTKLKNPVSGAIERIYNFKYPYEYCNRFEEQLKRKERIKEFYAELHGRY